MNTETIGIVKEDSRVGIVFALIVGLSIVAITGHVQASSLHNAAHDMRHATGFPCH